MYKKRNIQYFFKLVFTLFLFCFSVPNVAGSLVADHNITKNMVEYASIMDEKLFSTTLYTANGNESLDNKLISQLTQDENGFIWVGTAKGLFRYDGYEYKLINQNFGHFDFSDIYVRALFVDGQTLWIGSISYGMFKLDLNTYQVTHYFSDKKAKYNNNSLSGNRINDIIKDKDGMLWIASAAGLDKFDPKTEKFTQYRSGDNNRARPYNLVKRIVIDTLGGIWVSSGKGLAKFDPQAGSFSLIAFSRASWSKNDNKQRLKKIIIRDLFLAEDGRFWFATQKQGSFIFEPKTGYVIPLSLANNEAKINSSIVQINSDTIWISGASGIEVRNAHTGKFIKQIKANMLGEFGLKNNLIHTMMNSQANLIWLGVSGVGLQYFNTNNEAFKHVDINLPHLKALQGNHISRMAMSSVDDIILIAGGKALKFSLFSGKLTSFIDDPEFSTWEVSTLLHYSHSRYFFGNMDGELIHYDSITKIATLIELPLKRNKGTYILNIKRGANGNIWIATDRGVVKFTPETGVFKFVKNRNGSRFVLFVRDLLFDSQHRLWIGTANGLYLVRAGEMRVEPLPKNSIEGSLSDNFIIQTLENSKHEIFINTRSNIEQLVHIDDNSLRFKLFAAESKKTSKRNEYLFESAGGYWLDNRVYLDQKGDEIASFDSFDGSLNKGVSVALNQLSPTTYIHVFQSGLTLLTPEKLKKWQYNPPMVVTQVQVAQKHYVFDQREKSIYLRPEQRAFSVRFSALDFTNPKKNHYRYKLMGFDKYWNDSPADLRIAKYTSLPPGEYQLLIQGSNRSGQWSDKTLNIKIIVTPYFYEEFWFKIVTLFLFFVMIFFIVKWWIKKSVKNTKQLNEIKLQASQVKMTQALLNRKNELLANISHEFKTPLTLVYGPLQNAINKINNNEIKADLIQARSNTQRLTKMVEQIIQLAKIEGIKKKPSKVINLSYITHFLSSSMHSLFKERKIEVNIDIEKHIYIKMMVEEAETLIVNLLSNAAKYCNYAGKVEISLTKNQSQCLLSVSDSGEGLSEEQQEKIFQRFVRLKQHDNVTGSGIGLTLIKEIVEQNSGAIKLDSKLGKGSCFSVYLPCVINAELTDAEQDLANISLSSLYVESKVQQEFEIHEKNSFQRNKLEFDTTENRKTLLIVEDNQEMQEFIARSLEAHFNCLFAHNGEQGIAMALLEVPDLIITDLMMPHKSGLELAIAVRDSAITCHIPIIMLTAKSDEQSRKDAWCADIDAFLAKPFDQHELLMRIENILNIRKLMLERWQSTLMLSGSGTESKDLDPVKRNIDLEGFSKKDHKFIKQLENITQLYYNEPNFNVKQLSSEMAMSERQLQRKLKALLNKTASEYIRTFRLNIGADLLRQGAVITHVALDVGFSSQNYFSQCFKAHFGLSPSEYIK